MNSCSRYVLDTNIIVSALLFKRSQPRQALDKARSSGRLLMSQPIWEEVQAVLGREKFDQYITFSERQFFLMGLYKIVEFVDIQKTVVACRDPEDNKVLELAVNGRAQAIITGDQDLLVLHPFEGVSILTVKQFLERV
ncbi:MAG: putative toxin-antitoxin system toxin component, PIN family [Leptolyngbyaceae cyanobacterium]